MSDDILNGFSNEKSIEVDLDTFNALKKTPVDIFNNVYLSQTRPHALILCIDVRGFSDFMCSNDEEVVFSLIKSFTSNFLACINQFACNCSYYKLLGDGALVIWDKLDGTAIKEATTVFQTYTNFATEELFNGSNNLSLGGALVLDTVYKYEISAEVSQLQYRDYVGYGINLACRLQNLARGGQLIVCKKLVDLGAVFAKPYNDPDTLKKLRSLKGLKDEDKEAVFFYEDINTKIISMFNILKLEK